MEWLFVCFECREAVICRVRLFNAGVVFLFSVEVLIAGYVSKNFFDMLYLIIGQNKM